MRITQGCFSFLPDLTDEQISRQVQYCLGKGWAVNIEFTDDPHPRNSFWEMWGLPMFDLRDAAGALACEFICHHNASLRDDPRHRIAWCSGCCGHRPHDARAGSRARLWAG